MSSSPAASETSSTSTRTSRGLLGLIRVIYRTVFAAALLAAGAGFVATVAAPLVWQVQGLKVVTILSGSMEPGIKTGEQILIKPYVQGDQVHPNDVVTFRSGAGGKTLTTHRVLSIEQIEGEGTFVQTKGDNNANPDPDLTSLDSVVGVMDTALGEFGQWVGILQEPQWRIVAFAPALLLFCLAEVPLMLGRRPGR